MQVPAPEWSTLQPPPLPPGTLTARVAGGDLAALPVGELLRAVVVRVETGSATLLVQGRELIIQPSHPMKPGTVWLVRRPSPDPHPQVEYLAATADLASPTASGPAARSPTSASSGTVPSTLPLPTGATSTLPATFAAMVTSHPGLTLLVEVQDEVAPQTYRIQWLGQTMLARSEQALIPQQQHLVQLELRSDGLWLTRPANNTQSPSYLAAALLRHLPPADLAPALADLHQALAEWAFPGNSTSDPKTLGNQHAGSGETAVLQRIQREIRAVLESFLPSKPQPLTAQQLQHFVENGGLMYEARLVAASDPNSWTAPKPAPPDTSQTHAPWNATPQDTEIPKDLKGSLLQLVQSLRGKSEPALQAAAVPALHNITTLQAVNVLASHQGMPYWLQVPFPEGSAWRTLYMAVQPDYPVFPGDISTKGRSSPPPSSQRFHILIHAPLDTIGNTWIDMTLQGDRLHAVLYFDHERTLQQAIVMQEELHQMLQASDFTQIGIEFRSAKDLPARHRQHTEAMRQGRPPSLHLVDWEV